MTELPSWWLYVSGAAFLLSALFNLALIVGALVAWHKVEPLITDLQKQISKLGETVNGLATSAKSTVDIVHTRTENILGGAQDAGNQVVQRISSAGALITAAVVGVKVVGYLRGARSHDKKR